MPTRRVTITTVVGQVLPYHRDRRSWQILNIGIDTVWVSQDPANITTDGMPIYPGTSLEASAVDGDNTDMAIYGVASSGSQNLQTSEGYRS